MSSMLSISLCIVVALLPRASGNRRAHADIHQLDRSERHKEKETSSLVAVGVTQKNLQIVSRHDLKSSAASSSTEASAFKKLSPELEKELMEHGIVEHSGAEEQHDDADEGIAEAGALLESDATWFRRRKQKKDEDADDDDTEEDEGLNRSVVPVEEDGIKVIASAAIRLPTGLVPVGSLGVIKKSVPTNEVMWTMPSNIGSKWNYAHQSTHIVPDGQAPMVKQVANNQMLLRDLAQKPLAWADDGKNLSRRIKATKVSNHKCHHWMLQCQMDDFGNETDPTKYMRRVNVVRHRATDGTGGCDYSFECINAIPYQIDADTSEFIRAGFQCKSHWVGTKFWDCFAGKDKQRVNYWKNICGVCGYQCVGCNGGQAGNPYGNILEDQKRSEVFARDAR